MRKFLAVLKREYIQRVRARMFIVSTILLPMVMALFGIVPALVLNIEAGGPMRIAVIDQTGKMFGRLEDALVTDQSAGQQPYEGRTGPEMATRAFQLEQGASVGPDAAAERAKLDERLRSRELDGYLVLA